MEPPGQGWRETAFISSAFVFPLQVPGPIMQPPHPGGGGRRVTPPLLPWSFCCVNPHEMLVL